jgi:hypothetical protein
MDRQIRKVSWREFNSYVENLAFAVKKSVDEAELCLEYVYGIPRGGCIPAIMLSHFLDLEYRPELHFNSDWERTLVVDDIIDSGDTISQYIDHLHCASVFYREDACYEPMAFGAKLNDNTWIQFPWEKQVNDQYSNVNY